MILNINKRRFKYTFFTLLCTILLASCTAQTEKTPEVLSTGAEQLSLYLPQLEGKTVGLVGNHSSLVGQTHLVDTLQSLSIDLKGVFAPEHGFRGKADAGAHIKDGKDPISGLPVVSLYGKNKKPRPEQLQGIDLLLFDIQDVGARFYTYISTLHYVMEACAEQNIPLIVLDRPNPNGHYVDGNILDMAYTSFVGMHPIPVVHGMTIGEYAQMINGEQWLENGVQCALEVIPCANYDHNTPYVLPVKPSPNLPNARSIDLYTSLCFFEGTMVSVGRGTDFPFQVFGHPAYADSLFTFTPRPVSGAMHPKLEGKACHGFDLRKGAALDRIKLEWLIWSYEQYPEKDQFFNKFFAKLAGGDTLRQQIESGMSADEIRSTWADGLKEFMKVRAQYLLYPDFVTK